MHRGCTLVVHAGRDVRTDAQGTCGVGWTGRVASRSAGRRIAGPMTSTPRTLRVTNRRTARVRSSRRDGCGSHLVSRVVTEGKRLSSGCRRGLCSSVPGAGRLASRPPESVRHRRAARERSTFVHQLADAGRDGDPPPGNSSRIPQMGGVSHEMHGLECRPKNAPQGVRGGARAGCMTLPASRQTGQARIERLRHTCMRLAARRNISHKRKP